MKQLVLNFWNDQAVCLATLSAVGAAGVAASAVLGQGGSWYLATSAALGALGIGGGTAHAVGTTIRNK